ncbi:MAG: penicillin-binding protein 2 [Flavobacteriia bacterium]|nr:penicillin-binding protein 2 [Flavobacteriia bacterium]
MNLQSRKYVSIIMFLAIGIIYISRLFYMQVLDEYWTLRAAEISEKRKLVIPPRGHVVDRTGKLVVSNKPYYNLMMIEKNIKDLDTVALANLIGWEPIKIRERFKEIREEQGYDKNPKTGKRDLPRYQKVRPYVFVKEITIDEMAQIAPHLYKFPGFYEELSSMRYYSYPNAANILGYVSEVNQQEIDADSARYYRPGDNIGKAGIEKYYEKELRGIKGVNYIVTSAMNNELQPYANGKYDIKAKQGDRLQLGVDIELQVYGEQLMQNKRGTIVAIEPSTGEILTMVSAPTYDPNLLVGKRAIQTNYPKLLLDENKPLFPRPLQAEYPPGSIFKLLQSLIALQEGRITVNTGFPCNKSLVGCHNHPNARSIIEAVQMSCNPYYYQAVRRVIQPGVKKNIYADAEYGLGKWAEYMHNFGLGEKLATDIPGVRPGLIPDPNYYDNLFPSKRNPYGHHRWAFSTIRSISIGQGEVKVTPLQMANIAAMLANRGWFYVPHVVKSIGNKGSEKVFLEKHQTGINPQHFEPVIEGMRRVVYEAGGTARRARLNDIIICGKTGTAQNPHGEDHSVFICFAPKDNPKIAVAVFVENAGAGGTWAAPIASLIVEKYLKREVTEKEREKYILEANFMGKTTKSNTANE